jgi:molybdenum cofactor biosynthesis enzyme MoaA
MRKETSRGSINVNTNGSLPENLSELIDAGLDACRVSLNSAHKPLYEAYYQPVKYGWEDVAASIRLAKRRGIYVAVNLLTFPGVSDQEGEVEKLCEVMPFIDQVQTRSMAIDPDQYLEVARGRSAGGPRLGLREMLRRLKRARPGLRVGNFARGKGERWVR